MHTLLKNRQEITAWLNEYRVKKYTLVEDTNYGYVVDVEGDVILTDCKLQSIGVKFNDVLGTFNCNNNQLTSLQGCPKKVGGDFLFQHNDITSLKGCPQIVGKKISCGFNNIISLECCPQSIGGDFFCHYNKIT